MILRARVVLPISAPPIPDGAVEIRGARIIHVGRWQTLAARDRRRTMDLGEVALLPGLVNAHCHLDYTHMAGQFPPPRSFTDWLRMITATKAGWALADYAASWRQGAEMLLRSGTTTVADIEAVPQLLPEAWEGTPLRVVSFLELIGITARRPPQAVLREALDKIDSLGHRRSFAALSPHAPYSTVPELLRLSATAARRRRWLLCTHVAESAVEFAMFTLAHGEMFDWLKQSGRDMSDCGRHSPVRHLERCGLLGENLLAAHVNYLARHDAARLGRHRVSVVHCPRSHLYFRHAPFPLRTLARARVNLCLGTDSLATVHTTRRQSLELSLFDEMRTLAHQQPELSARAILRMATINGARALDLAGKIGELAPGAQADLIAVPFAGPTTSAYDAVLEHKGRVTAGLIGGRWAFPPGAQP